MSESLELVDFSLGPVDFVFHFANGQKQVKFLRENFTWKLKSEQYWDCGNDLRASTLSLQLTQKASPKIGFLGILPLVMPKHSTSPYSYALSKKDKYSICIFLLRKQPYICILLHGYFDVITSISILHISCYGILYLIPI